MMKIVKLQLKSVGKLLEEQDMGFAFTNTAIKEIVRSGFDPVYGARPLRRAIQKVVENPISSLIIEGKMTQGDIVTVDYDGDAFVFNIEKPDLTGNTTETVQNFTPLDVAQFITRNFPADTLEIAKVLAQKYDEYLPLIDEIQKPEEAKAIEMTPQVEEVQADIEIPSQLDNQVGYNNGDVANEQKTNANTDSNQENNINPQVPSVPAS
ncbi:MAG: hypothetical protein WCO06_02425 [Candidatus Roizmanbacteria bacterium]